MRIIAREAVSGWLASFEKGFERLLIGVPDAR